MRDQELTDDVVLNRNAYDEIGPYDLDFGGAGPARPAPVPYNDPYSDQYTVPEVPKSGPSNEPNRAERSHPPERASSGNMGGSRDYDRNDARARGRGRGRGRG